MDQGFDLTLALRFWGKAKVGEHAAYHPLLYHSLDVAAVGRVLLERDKQLQLCLIGAFQQNEDRFLSLIAFLLALHDLGKFDEGFQNLEKDLFLALRGRTSTRAYNVRHDSLGYLAWQQVIWPSGWRDRWLRIGDECGADQYDWEEVLRPWVQAVTGHHGRPPRLTASHGLRLSFQDHFDAEARTAMLSFAKESACLLLGKDYPPLEWKEEYLRLFARSSWLLAGLAVLSDWIGSNADYFPYSTPNMSLSEYWSERALPQARRAVEASGVLPPNPSSLTGINVLFDNIAQPSPLQNYVSSCDIGERPQLFILEEATGSGKTEAALTLAHRLMAAGHAETLFMALPTMATANAMYERLAGCYRRIFDGIESPSLILSHSSRHLSAAFRDSIGIECPSKLVDSQGEESATAQCAVWLADNRKKAHLAAVGVGTLDQALLAILPSYHQSLRLLGLGRGVLIVDEVHAYDAYMHTLLRTLLEFQASQGGSAILLSATLPMRLKRELAASFRRGLGANSSQPHSMEYPLITRVSPSGTEEVPLSIRSGTEKTVSVEIVNNEAGIEEQLKCVAERGFCACWVRNTVHDAVAAYERLARTFEPDQLLLFHARFAMGDRLAIEDQVLRRFGKESTHEERRGRVLVATQVVEQSLDLDFDFLVTDLAPIDLVIQRAGRLHRHPRGGRGQSTLLLFSPPVNNDPNPNWYAGAFPLASYVYPRHGQLWLTAKLLAEAGSMTMPSDARRFVEAVYAEDNESQIPAALQERDNRAHGEQMAVISHALLNALKLDEGYTTTINQWLDDTISPTRVGDPTTTVRLARWNGSELRPWFQSERFPWDLSQVSVRRVHIKDSAQHDRRLEAAIEKARSEMPDKGKWSVLVPLRLKEDGTWLGRASNERGDVGVLYDPKTGLRVVPPAKDGDES